MTTDEVIAWFDNWISDYCDIYDIPDGLSDMVIFALHVLQKQESNPLNEWISVKDRLPRCGDRVIMTDGVFVCEAFLSISGKWKRNGIDWIESEITHWMPMPEPPEMEKTEE